MTASEVPAETYSAYTHFLEKVKSCNIYLRLWVRSWSETYTKKIKVGYFNVKD